MTVFELIEELKTYPMDTAVYVPQRNDREKVYITSLIDCIPQYIPDEKRQILVLV